MVYRNDKYLAATPKVFRWDFLYFLKDANIVKLLTRKHLSALQKQKNVLLRSLKINRCLFLNGLLIIKLV